MGGRTRSCSSGGTSACLPRLVVQKYSDLSSCWRLPGGQASLGVAGGTDQTPTAAEQGREAGRKGSVCLKVEGQTENKWDNVPNPLIFLFGKFEVPYSE